jgi:hypothetical protein
MTLPLQTVTLHLPALQIPVLITRLTAYLLHHRYNFLQTCYDATHFDFDIFKEQQPLVRLTLRPAATPEALAEPVVLAALPHLAADAVDIIQHLLQT